jgi:hypothetical protein
MKGKFKRIIEGLNGNRPPVPEPPSGDAAGSNIMENTQILYQREVTDLRVGTIHCGEDLGCRF